MDDNSISLPKWFMWIAAFFAIVVIFSIGLYFFFFAKNGFGNPEEFSWFGSYVGGLISPILTFITVCLLIWSVHIQRDELKLSTKELRKSSEALIETQTTQKNSFNLQQRELCRKEIQDTFEFQYNLTVDLLTSPMYTVLYFQKKASIFTLSAAINRDFPESVQRSSTQNPTLNHILTQLKSDIYSLHNSSVLDELDYLVSLLAELNKVSTSEYVKLSFANRVKKLLMPIHTTKIISESQYQKYLKSINDTHITVINPVDEINELGSIQSNQKQSTDTP